MRRVSPLVVAILWELRLNPLAPELFFDVEYIYGFVMLGGL